MGSSFGVQFLTAEMEYGNNVTDLSNFCEMIVLLPIKLFEPSGQISCQCCCRYENFRR